MHTVQLMPLHPKTHGLDGQHQDADMTPRGRVNHNDRRLREMEKYVHGVANPRTAIEQKRTVCQMGKRVSGARTAKPIQ